MDKPEKSIKLKEVYSSFFDPMGNEQFNAFFNFDEEKIHENIYENIRILYFQWMCFSYNKKSNAFKEYMIECLESKINEIIKCYESLIDEKEGE
jgi:hypothetical protein